MVLSIVCADVTHVTLGWIIDDVGVDGVEVPSVTTLTPATAPLDM